MIKKKLNLKIFLKSNFFFWGGILVLGVITRFWGLKWAFPYTPHPDELNMALAISRFSWPENLNPQFYAYGQFPLYLSYFTAILVHRLQGIKSNQVSILQAIFFLRFWSAVASLGTVFFVYRIGEIIFKEKTAAKMAALITVFTPGLVQIAHFGTTESLLSFFFMGLAYLALKILETNKFSFYFLAGIFLGLSFATKLTGLLFGVPLGLVFLGNLKKYLGSKKNIGLVFSLLLKNLGCLLIAVLTALVFCPYLVLSFQESKNTLLYEISVAKGTTNVFYTRQFIKTIPVIFQLEKIFPYVMGWPLFVFGLLGFCLSFFYLIKFQQKKLKLVQNLPLLIFNLSFLAYFLYQSFLFCKWTRFMAPIFAFFPIFALFFIKRSTSTCCQLVLVFLCLIPGVLFNSVYFLPDIRFTASEWIYRNIPEGSVLLFDTGNVVDIPITSEKRPVLVKNYKLVSFDFYHLDENKDLFQKLIDELEEANFILVPSRRIFKNHLRLADDFPLTAKYYELLFSGKLGFIPVAKIEPFYSKIFNDEEAEETFTVFDHPTIRIYQKEKFLSKEEYSKLFLE